MKSSIHKGVCSSSSKINILCVINLLVRVSMYPKVRRVLNLTHLKAIHDKVIILMLQASVPLGQDTAFGRVNHKSCSIGEASRRGYHH